MIFYYNKLVRDKIIENIERKGHKCEYKKLSKDEYKKELDKKLLEEANEVIEVHNAEEISDLMEVIETIMQENNISFEEVKQAMQKKRETNGIFKDRLFLISVDEKDK